MLFLQAGQKLLSRFVVAQEQRSGFSKGPLEVHVADLLACGAQAFATRFLPAFAQATIRSQVLHAGKAADVMDCIPQHEAEHLANAGNRLQQVQSLGIVVRGRTEAEAIAQVTEALAQWLTAAKVIHVAVPGEAPGNP